MYVYVVMNESRCECVYVRNSGTYEMSIKSIVELVCKRRCWAECDRIVVMPLEKNMSSSVCYIYENKVYKVECNNERNEWIEIETNEEEVYESNETNEINEMKEVYEMNEMNESKELKEINEINEMKEMTEYEYYEIEDDRCDKYGRCNKDGEYNEEYYNEELSYEDESYEC